MMCLHDLLYLKVIDCIISLKDLIHINDFMHPMVFERNCRCRRHLIKGKFFEEMELFKATREFFNYRDGCFECGEVDHIKILVQILLHSSPPLNMDRTGKCHYWRFNS